jgi:hypothetical protein
MRLIQNISADPNFRAYPLSNHLTHSWLGGNLWPATKLFALDGGKAEDVIYRQSDASHLKDMIRQVIVQSGLASFSEIESLLRDRLPAALTEDQKHNRLKYVLALMRDEGVVECVRVGPRASVWKLKNPISTNNPSKITDFQ